MLSALARLGRNEDSLCCQLTRLLRLQCCLMHHVQVCIGHWAVHTATYMIRIGL